MKRYVITNIIPIKGRKVELYSIQAESKEDAERKFIKGDTGYFLHSEYEDLVNMKILQKIQINVNLQKQTKCNEKI